MEQENNFSVLENKTIGRNIHLYRKIRGLRAIDVAEKIGLKESAYTRYERGEGAITVDLIQQIAEVLKVDPLSLITTTPGSFIDSGNNATNSIVAVTASNCHTISEQQIQLITRLVESVITLNEKLTAMLEKQR